MLLSTNDRNSDDANCGPLSDTISSGKPKRAKTSFILATHAAVVVLFTCNNSIHRVVIYYDKGHRSISPKVGLNVWQCSRAATMRLTSLVISGHQADIFIH